MRTKYPREAWAQHLKSLQWKQGEHMLISAPTGAGKTTIASKLLEKRANVIFFVSKLQDPIFREEFKQYKRLTDWPKHGPKSYDNRILLWPKQGKTLEETLEIQREIFSKAIEHIAKEGKRTLVIDESLYMTDQRYMGLHKEIGMLHYFGRSAGITMVDLTQRPAWIPKIIYSSVTHAYIAKTRDKQDTERLSDLGGVDAKEIALNLTTLPTRHDYVYINPLGDGTPRVINTRQ